MLRYCVGRILILIPTLLLVIFVTFLLGYLGPVDPVMIIARDNAARGIYFTPEEIADLRHQYGLDRPFLAQFGTYLNNLLHGSFGYSYRDAAPVLPRIIGALPVSGSLALGAMLILILFGIPLGFLAARFHNTLIDYLIVGGSLFLNAVPVYVLVPVSLIIFVLWLDLMTVPRGWKGILHPHFVLAAALMSLRTLAVVIRQTRAGMLDVLANDYIRTARAKGLREIRVMTRHVLRNSLIPVVTQLGLMVDDFMWGAVFIDLAFNLPGLGRLFEQGLSSRDFNFIYGVVIFTAFLTMIINLLIDLLYPLLDPRVMYD